MEVARRLGVLVLEWAAIALGVFIAGQFGYLTYKDIGTLAVVAVVLGLFNSFLRPFLLAIFMIVSIPILILTLGLGIYLVLFVTNGAILALTDSLLKDFSVNSWAMATLTISVISWMISSAVGIDQLKPLRRANEAKANAQKAKEDAIDI
ncbi:MAG: phage holin family protein [Opitutales bacterium]|jgi:putative membrane protein